MILGLDFVCFAIGARWDRRQQGYNQDQNLCSVPHVACNCFQQFTAVGFDFVVDCRNPLSLIDLAMGILSVMIP